MKHYIINGSDNWYLNNGTRFEIEANQDINPDCFWLTVWTRNAESNTVKHADCNIVFDSEEEAMDFLGV